MPLKGRLLLQNKLAPKPSQEALGTVALGLRAPPAETPLEVPRYLRAVDASFCPSSLGPTSVLGFVPLLWHP